MTAALPATECTAGDCNFVSGFATGRLNPIQAGPKYRCVDNPASLTKASWDLTNLPGGGQVRGILQVPNGPLCHNTALLQVNHPAGLLV